MTKNMNPILEDLRAMPADRDGTHRITAAMLLRLLDKGAMTDAIRYTPTNVRHAISVLTRLVALYG